MPYKIIIILLILSCVFSSVRAQTAVDTTKPPENIQQNISLSRDTIQFDARQYAVNYDAFLEDLANKIPGLTANSDGSYNIRGEKATEVLINGSQFFMENDGAVLKNYPAFFIQGVSFFDDLSFQSSYAGSNDAGYDRVLNFITEPDYYRSIFGRAYAGYGYKGKWNAGINANLFHGKRKLSIIGQTNNINSTPYTPVDILGINKTASNAQDVSASPNDASSTIGSLANFSIDQSNGINTTNSAGISYFDQYGKWKFYGNYFFNSTDNITSGVYVRNYLDPQADNTTNYTDTSNTNSYNLNHRFKFRTYFMPNEKDFFRTTLNFSAQKSRSDNSINDTYYNNDTITSQSNGTSHIDMNGAKGSISLDYVHRFNKPNRSLIVNITPSLANIEGYNEFKSYVTLRTIPLPLNVRTDIKQKETGINASIAYAEPIGERNLLQISYKPSFTTGDYNQSIDSLSSLYANDDSLFHELSNKYILQALGAAWQYRADDWYINAGLDLQYAALNTNTTGLLATDVSKNYFNVLPTVSFVLNTSKRQNLKVNLKSYTQAPKFSDQLQTITIISPLNWRFGNPQLDQEWHSLLNARYTALLPDGKTTWMASGSAEYIRNYIGQNTITDYQNPILEDLLAQNGVSVVRPVNLKNYFTANLYVDYGRQLPFIFSNFDINMLYNYTYLPSQVNSVPNLSKQNTGSLGLRFSSSASEYVDFLVVINLSYTNVRNSGNTAQSNYFKEVAQAQANIMPWRGLIINTSISQHFDQNITLSTKNNYILWNAYVGYKFLGPRSYEIRFTAHDILNQNSRVNYSVTDIYTQTLQTNNIQRYFMLSFIFDFNFPQKTLLR